MKSFTARRPKDRRRQPFIRMSIRVPRVCNCNMAVHIQTDDSRGGVTGCLWSDKRESMAPGPLSNAKEVKMHLLDEFQVR